MMANVHSGVDVTENNVTAHKCVQLDVIIIAPNDNVANAAADPVAKKEDLSTLSQEVLIEEVCVLVFISSAPEPIIQVLRLRQDKEIAKLRNNELVKAANDAAQQQVKLDTQLLQLTAIIAILEEKADRYLQVRSRYHLIKLTNAILMLRTL